VRPRAASASDRVGAGAVWRRRVCWHPGAGFHRDPRDHWVPRAAGGRSRRAADGRSIGRSSAAYVHAG
jgi:hypothetical protein